MQDLREVSGAFFEKERKMFMSRRLTVARPARAAWFYQAAEFTSHTYGRLVIFSLREPLIAMAGILKSRGRDAQTVVWPQRSLMDWLLKASPRCQCLRTCLRWQGSPQMRPC